MFLEDVRKFQFSLELRFEHLYVALELKLYVL